MNISKMKSLISDVQENLDDALIMSAVVSYESGASIVQYEFDDKQAALLSKYTTFLVDTFSKAEKDAEIVYYALKFPDTIMAFILVFKGYCWVTVVDTGKVPLGMIMNAVLPECIEKFKVAIS